MITDTTDKNQLVTAIEEVISQLLGLISSVAETQVNTVPYPGSWTAAQVVRHVTKSTQGIARAIGAAAKPADRDPSERIPELKAVFLDFSTKLQSPEFIVPEVGPYQKQIVIEALQAAFNQLKERASKADVTEVVEGLPLGSVSKWEMLHFVLYHTQRHVHQLQKITDALTK
jgi:hypothetical protein